MFGILNSLNIPQHGAEMTLLEAKGKIQFFKEKLGLWGRRGKSETMQIFLSFSFSTFRGTGSLRERHYVPRNSETRHGRNYSEWLAS
jgi:hypothetical protein